MIISCQLSVDKLCNVYCVIILLFATRYAWNCSAAPGGGAESSTETSSICEFIVAKLRILLSDSVHKRSTAHSVRRLVVDEKGCGQASGVVSALTLLVGWVTGRTPGL